MRLALALLMALHGALHLLGFVKAFGLARVPQLQRSIGPGAGLLWLTAAALLVAGAVVLLTAPRYWWVPALPGVVLSQGLIFGAWADARFGTIPNVIILIPLVLAVADLRESSLLSMYRTDVRRELQRGVAATSPPVTEEALAPLPPPVRSYLRRAGVVGQPRVRSFRARFRGSIRGGPGEPWMSGPVEQHEFFGPLVRLFFMKAHRAGVPVDVFHRYAGDAATMRARLLGVLPVMDVAGPELTRSETVTVLNDIFLFAPAVLVDLAVGWEEVDERSVRATWSHGGHTVSAVARFDDAGDLVDFHSDDRYRFEGGSFRLFRWSTPVKEYRQLGSVRLPALAEARWTEPSGPWTYARLELEDIAYNVV